jgi:hypothetical protein
VCVKIKVTTKGGHYMKLNKIIVRDFEKMDEQEKDMASHEILKIVIGFVIFIIFGSYLTY